MATIFDVAARAGVGVGTVSRVLNGSPLVSDSTRTRVLEVIDELDYHPSSLARGLSLGRTSSVGVVVPFFTSPSVVERLRGVVHVLNETAYDVVLFNVETPEQRDARFRSVLRRDRAEGAIVISLRPQVETAPVDTSIPIVYIDAPMPGHPHLWIDNEAGGELATGHLVGLGHRRIAFVGDLEEDPFGFTSSRDRLRGYRRALEGADVEVRPDYVRLGRHGREVAHRLTHELLDLKEPPTAIFAASDTQALGVLEAVRRRGLRVPGAVSIVGFDDIEVAPYVGLTTVNQALYESGVVGAQMLLGIIDGVDEGDDSDRGRRMPLSIVVRESTGPPA